MIKYYGYQGPFPGLSECLTPDSRLQTPDSRLQTPDSRLNMWTCPKCKRSFKRKDQLHTCVLISKDSLFAKRPPELKKLYELIVNVVKKFGEYREETVRPDVIFFKTKSTFLAVKVKIDHLEVEFFLDHLENMPPVSKFLQTSKHRVAHLVPVDDAKDIDHQLIKWMRLSYELISN